MRIRNTSKKAPRVRHVGQKAARVDPVEVGRALGAERIGLAGWRGGGPLALFALRQDLAERLRSTGGRRGLAGTTRRQKIPLGELDWSVLEYLASRLRREGHRPSASQEETKGGPESAQEHGADQNLAAARDWADRGIG